ncbi:MAG: hypothetical protein ACK2TZ_06040 [Anaerolineales bacterium]
MRAKAVVCVIFASFIMLAASSCSSSANPDWISQAGLFTDPSGTQPTDSYGWREIFYLVVEFDQPPQEAIIQASWIAVDTTRLRPDTIIKIEEKEAQESPLVFELENAGNFWPEGDYQVNVYVNETLYKEIKFIVHMTDVH